MAADPRRASVASHPYGPALRTALLLTLPLAFYLVPIMEGFAWSSVNPNTPNVPGMEAANVRRPDTAISIESYGTGVVVVPFQARLRAYLSGGHLPLWNPYQGLGQPFAAQGEGGPYFPVAILRALLPYSWGNLVSVAFVYVSSVACHALIRGLGGTSGAALFAGLIWPLVGALTLHIPRFNIFDQLCMLPIVFWAAERAVRVGRSLDRVVLAVMICLNVLAGFIQIVLPGTLVLIGFLGLYGIQHFGFSRDALRRWLALLIAVALGHSLAAFYVLPIVESVYTAFNPRSDILAFLPIPYANVISFFLPYLFGQYFRSWLHGPYTDITDWNNLYGHLGVVCALITVVGVCASRPGRQRTDLIFFAGFGVFLLLRYISFPPIAAVNMLPLLSRQSPKHANGVAVFCFVVAAALAIDALRERPGKRVRWVVLATIAGLVSTILTLVMQLGGVSAIDVPAAALYGPVSAGIVISSLAAIAIARRAGRLEASRAFIIVAGAAVAELSLYLPLGNGSAQVLAARLGIACLILTAAGLVTYGRNRSGALAIALSAGVYALVIAIPATGLPNRFDVDTPPPYMRWLKEQVGDDYRVFGIAPDFSSVASVQDLEATGPFSTQSLADVIDMTAPERLREYYRTIGHFRLHGSNPDTIFNLRDYGRAKPIFDWLGVRYLVLERAAFRPGGRADYEWVRLNSDVIPPAYESTDILVLESPEARPKAGFWTQYEVATSHEAVLAELRAAPSRILGPPLLEAPGLAASIPSEAIAREQGVSVVAYTPNAVHLVVDADASGIVVLRDASYPGWLATVDGVPTTVLRVNGLVRGVYVAEPGRHEIVMMYRPMSVTVGAGVSAATGIVLVGLVMVPGGWRRRRWTATR